MWLSGVFGIATKYAEAVLSVKCRVKMPNGMMTGGPMYALERGLGSRPLSSALTKMAFEDLPTVGPIVLTIGC